MTRFVELSYSDQYFAVIYEPRSGASCIRVFNMKDVLAHGKKEGSVKHVLDILPPSDNHVTCLKWGPLDESIIYGTNRGKLIKHSVA
jgi:hypothetical protein